MKRCLVLLVIGLSLVVFGMHHLKALDAASSTAGINPTVLQWWKGNLHTHSMWSDGDDYPEMIIEWYHQHGYHFLGLSDHNILSQGQKWIVVDQSSGGRIAYNKYLERFGSDWVEQRQENEKLLVRLKPLNEFRHLFEQPNRFLLIQSEEITDHYLDRPVHINATNLAEVILPQGGASIQEVMQNNVNAVLQQRKRTGQPMFPHIDHPNFGWALTAENIIALQGDRFFEIYNGHPAVRNYGDAQHASAQRVWDIVLTRRLTDGDGKIIYGLAVDDAHQYHVYKAGISNPGRGWVMVRAKHLTSEAIITAMEAGDFYASTGVTLNEVSVDGDGIHLKIQPETGVSYATQFIGTPKRYHRRSEPVLDASHRLATRRYSEEIGRVLAEVEGTSPSYRFTGNELYVRAKIISSKPKANPYAEAELEVAWTQPFVPQK